jgi:large subunit ribosomal protein L29
MKAQVLTDIPENELRELLATEREKLIKMKMNHAVSPMENPLQIKFTRKAIARVMTEISKRRNTSK